MALTSNRIPTGRNNHADVYLERLLMGSAQALMADAAAFEVDARRVVRLGSVGVDLERVFAGAVFRSGGDLASWAGWPDLVWTEMAFGAARDPFRLAAELWLAMPVGAVLTAIEVEEATDLATRRWLTEGRGLRHGFSAIRAVQERFRVVQTSRVRSPCGTCVARVLVARKQPSVR